MTKETLIIIVTFNGDKWIEKCINSLLNESDSHIYVIDCNSSDQTINILQKYRKRISVYYSTINLGFGKANNIGLRYAISHSYQYVFLVNQDTVCKPGIIEKLKKTHRFFPGYGILSPMHFYTDQTLDKKFESYLKKSSTPTFSHFLQKKKIINVDFVNAAFWFMPIETIKTIGGFDPIFRHYGEDVDYNNRLKLAGKKVGIVPECIAYHLRNQSHKNKISIRDWETGYNINARILLKNPNKSYAKCLLKLHVKVLRNSISSMMQLNFNRFIGILSSYIKTAGKFIVILKHRKLYTLNGNNLQKVEHKNNLFLK